MHVMYFVEKVLHSKIVLKNICLIFICVCKYVVNILFLGHNFILKGKKRESNWCESAQKHVKNKKLQTKKICGCTWNENSKKSTF